MQPSEGSTVSLLEIIHQVISTHFSLTRGTPLSFVQAKCCMSEPLDDGRNFLETACGTSQGVKAFKAEQRVEDIDDLIDLFGRDSSRLLGDSPNEDSQALSSPFVSCLDHVLEVRVECGQGAEPARD